MFSFTSIKFSNLLGLLFLLLFIGCKDDDNSPGSTPDPDLEAERTHEFVWEAMNSWYYFRDEVNELDDSFNDDEADYYSYLNSFDGPEELFESLIADPFSYIVADYDELGSSLQAAYDDFGFDFGLIRISGGENVLGYVRYVFEDSQAAEAGLERGDFFLSVDDTELTQSNFFELLFEQDSYELGMVEIVEGEDENGDPVLSIEDNGETIAVADEEFAERTPIWVQKTIDLANGKKVGYLNYSNFASDFHSELNQAFGDFKSEGITDLVLDLRYNPGGSLLTATYLNSMIYSTNENELMGIIRYNSKHSNNNGNVYFADEVEVLDENFEPLFTEPLNSVGLDRLYVLTSQNTASASEFVINALDPLIDVIVIGETTVGKNLGSRSLYDSPSFDYTSKDDANENHTYGLQPIVSKIYNSDDQSDYDNGFPPDGEEVNELDFLPELKPLGDPEEPLLAIALEDLCPACRVIPVQERRTNYNIELIGESRQYTRNYRVLDVTGLQ